MEFLSETFGLILSPIEQECRDGIGSRRVLLPAWLRRRADGPGDEDRVPGAGVQEADVRPGKYHIIGRRTLLFDNDSIQQKREGQVV